jgi:ribosomal protein L7/L12
LLRQQGIHYDPLGDVPPQVREALDHGERILAIKRLREATGLGLKDAKDQVDELRRRRGGVVSSDR